MKNDKSLVNISYIEDKKKVKTPDDAVLYINYCLHKKGITHAELVEILNVFPKDHAVIMQSIHSSLKDNFVAVFFGNQTIAFEDIDFEDATPKLS